MSSSNVYHKTGGSLKLKGGDVAGPQYVPESEHGRWYRRLTVTTIHTLQEKEEKVQVVDV